MKKGPTYSKGKIYRRTFVGIKVDANEFPPKTVGHCSIPLDEAWVSKDDSVWIDAGTLILALGIVAAIDSTQGLGSGYGRWVQFYSFQHNRTVWMREGWFTRDFELVK